MLFSWPQSPCSVTKDDFMVQVLPEFLQVEAFAKLNNAIGKVNVGLLPWKNSRIIYCLLKTLFPVELGSYGLFS